MSVDEVSELIDELKYGHPETRKKAAMRLGRIREERVIPHLINAALKDDYSWTRISAIQSLQWIADKNTIDIFLQIAKSDPDELVRKTAIEALSAFKDEKYIDELTNMLNDPMLSDNLRNIIQDAIKNIRS